MQLNQSLTIACQVSTPHDSSNQITYRQGITPFYSAVPILATAMPKEQRGPVAKSNARDSTKGPLASCTTPLPRTGLSKSRQHSPSIRPVWLFASTLAAFCPICITVSGDAIATIGDLVAFRVLWSHHSLSGVTHHLELPSSTLVPLSVHPASLPLGGYQLFRRVSKWCASRVLPLRDRSRAGIARMDAAGRVQSLQDPRFDKHRQAAADNAQIGTAFGLVL